MELVVWRLKNEADPRIGDEVEPDLVRRAWCSAGDRAGKAPVDCAVQVAARDAFDLGMACDDFGKSRGIVEAEVVHVSNPRRDRDLVSRDRDGASAAIAHRRGGPLARKGAQRRSGTPASA